MNIIKINHVDFVPSKLTDNHKIEGVFVFSHRKGKRIYKKPRNIGVVRLAKNENIYCYQHLDIMCPLSYDTMLCIARFLRELNDNETIFDNEQGTLTRR